MRRISVLAIALAALTAPPLAAQDRLTGEWTGQINTPGTPLEVTVAITRAADGSHNGTIDIPQQNARGLPLSGIRATADSATFAIQGVPGNPTFRGAFSADGDTLSGAFLQGGGSITFRLVRGSGAEELRSTLEDLDALIEQALRDFNVPGAAVGVLKNGEVVLAKGYGHRDVARKLPVTPQTVFAIGSSTKAFTTFALGMMADSGRFDWDRPVLEYLPSLRLHDEYATAHLTPRDMVTHRSGLPRHDLAWYANRTLAPDSMLALMRHFEPNRELREAWQYNNMMYVLSGVLLSKLTGASWEASLQRLIIDPLGMTHTNFDVDVSKTLADHALPYRESGDSVIRVEFRDISHVGPAGSVNSSIEDMLKWTKVHLSEGRIDGGPMIRGATLREMHTPQMVMPGFPTEPGISPSTYGLGWMIQTYRNHYRVFHGGNIDGFSALVTLFPMDRLGIVVLTNLNGTPVPELLTRHIADRVLELEQKPWLADALMRRRAALASQKAATERLDAERVRNTRPSHPLAAYAGEYEHPGYGRLQVRVSGDRLHVRFGDIETPFEHWHYDVFNGLENPREPVFRNMKLQFRNDLRGRVDEALLTMEAQMPPIRFARAPDAQLRDPAYIARFTGRYTIDGGGLAIISQSGNTLALEVPGQPRYDLVPDRDQTFTSPALPGYAVRFVLDASGRVERMEMVQPNGVFIGRPQR